MGVAGRVCPAGYEDQPGLAGPGHVRFREKQAIANRLARL
jgi:hypothetical protein